MEIALYSQILVLLWSLVLGAILSLLYVVFRIFEEALRLNNQSLFIMDVSYLILCAFATFIYMLIASDGEIRGYVITGEIVGWIAYRTFIGIIKKCNIIAKRAKNK